MRRELLRAGQALVLAGLMGGGSLWADEAVPSTSLPSAIAGDGSQVVVIEASKARTWAMLIELELLSDPATFPYALKVQANARGMEVRGYAPNTIVRDRALALAQKVCPMQVADGLIVQRNMGLPMPTALAEDIEAGIRERLSRALSPGASPIEFQVTDNGQVTLSGQAASLREQLECSRRLRGLKGITSVRNELSVFDALPAVPSGLMGAVCAMEPAPEAGAPAEISAPAPMETPRSPYAPRPAQFDPVQSPAHPARQSYPGSRQSPVVRMAQAPETPAAALPNAPVRSTIMPPPPVTPAKGTLSQEIAAREAAAPADLEEIKAVTATAAPAPGPKAEVLPAPEAVPSPLPPAVAKAVPPPSPRAQAALKARIRAAIGKSARRVDLSFDGKGGVLVVVDMPNHADIELAISRAIQVPELQAYEVSFNMRMEGHPPAQPPRPGRR